MEFQLIIILTNILSIPRLRWLNLDWTTTKLEPQQLLTPLSPLLVKEVAPQRLVIVAGLRLSKGYFFSCGRMPGSFNVKSKALP